MRKYVREETRKLIGYPKDVRDWGDGTKHDYSPRVFTSRWVPNDDIYYAKYTRGIGNDERYVIADHEYGIDHRTIDYTDDWFKAIQRKRREEKKFSGYVIRMQAVANKLANWKETYPSYDEEAPERSAHYFKKRLVVRKL